LLIVLMAVIWAVLGLWLCLAGGSSFYLVAGIALLLCAFLLARQSSHAWSAHALLLIGAIIWAWWEAGMDQLVLHNYCDLPFTLGLLLLLPPYAAKLRERRKVEGQRRRNVERPRWPLSRIALGAALLLFVGISSAARFGDQYRIAGDPPVHVGA
jgi:quinoprotein glucose dehydrogenase